MSARVRAQVLRGLGVLAVVVAIGAATVAPAAAHASLVSSNPTQGQALDTLPARVDFVFSEDMSQPAYVVVTAPDGTSVTAGDPVVDGTEVSQALGASDAQGTYTMAYRAVSADGHPVTGQLTFDVGRGGDSSAAPIAAAGSGGSARWVVLGVLAVLFALAATLFLRSRRSRS